MPFHPPPIVQILGKLLILTDVDAVVVSVEKWRDFLTPLIH